MIDKNSPAAMKMFDNDKPMLNPNTKHPLPQISPDNTYRVEYPGEGSRVGTWSEVSIYVPACLSSEDINEVRALEVGETTMLYGTEIARVLLVVPAPTPVPVRRTPDHTYRVTRKGVCIRTGVWFEVSPHLPSPLSASDIDFIVEFEVGDSVELIGGHVIERVLGVTEQSEEPTSPKKPGPVAEQVPTKTPRPANKYMRQIKPGVWVDVYDVLSAFGVTCPGMQHAVKKCLAPGQRGVKGSEQDKREAMDAIQRSIVLEKEC
jgi:hypothetical protein